jgi:archaellum component FlaC
MATPTDTELKEVLNAIAALSQRVEVGFAEIKGEIKALDQRVTGIDQKVTALDDRIKTQDTKFWTLVTIIIGSLSTLLIRLLVFPATPPA